MIEKTIYSSCISGYFNNKTKDLSLSLLTMVEADNASFHFKAKLR